MPDRPNFPIPENINADLYCLQLWIPNDPTWKSVVAGCLYELQYWFNWQRDEFNSGKQCAAVWKEVYKSIDWSTMSCCCDEPIPVQYRYTGDGVLERSTDGGATWVESPEYDPRKYSPQFPPMAGGDGNDKKCIAATGMKNLIKEQVGDQLTDDMSRYTLNQLITDWVKTMIESSNPFVALVTVITNQIFALIIATLRPALTDGVYEQLVCCFYCNMANDASFNDAQFDATRSQILSDITGIAGIFLEHLVYLLGTTGLTNLARAGGATEGDCSECCPDAEVFIWDELAGAPTQIFPDELGIYSANSGTGLSAGYYVLSIFFQDAIPIPAHWKCHNVNLISQTGGGSPIKYRCSDYAFDALATCTAQVTYRSNTAPFSITFTIEDLCGEE